MNKTPGQRQLQEMMAQSQKQMADQRQRSMQISWTQKQQEEARRREEESLQKSKGGGQANVGWQSGGYFQADERFSRVEDEVARLKQQLHAGRLSDERFNEQLKNLMVEDDNGVWWMIGATSNAWYRFDGQNWVQSTPPGRWVQGGNTLVDTKRSTNARAHAKGHPFGAILLFFFLLGLFIVAGFASGWFVSEILGIQGIMPFVPASILWASGFFIALNRARRTWHGD